MIKFQLLRHATTVLEIAGQKIMIDPVFGFAHSKSPFPTKKGFYTQKNPLVDLPLPESELVRIISEVNAVLVTHTHIDHFDDRASDLLPKDILVYCQPNDFAKFIRMGFKNVRDVSSKCTWGEVELIRTQCKHGGFFLRYIVGKSSGFVLKTTNETLYITGDSIWCKYIENAINEYTPDYIIVYGGGAQLPIGRTITMGQKDISNLCELSKDSQKVIVHMEAMNHCLLKRDKLKKYLNEFDYSHTVHILNDGETIVLKEKQI